MAQNLGSSVPGVLIVGTAGAILGALGTLIVQRLLPEPKPGDGFTVRWFDKDGKENRLDMGSDEKAALERAILLARKFAGVEVIEIRQGRIVGIQRAGQPERAVE